MPNYWNQPNPGQFTSRSPIQHPYPLQLTYKDDIHPEGEESQKWRKDLFNVGIICAWSRDGGADFRVTKRKDEGHDPTERPNDERSADRMNFSRDTAWKREEGVYEVR